MRSIRSFSCGAAVLILSLLYAEPAQARFRYGVGEDGHVHCYKSHLVMVSSSSGGLYTSYSYNVEWTEVAMWRCDFNYWWNSAFIAFNEPVDDVSRPTITYAPQAAPVAVSAKYGDAFFDLVIQDGRIASIGTDTRRRAVRPLALRAVAELVVAPSMGAAPVFYFDKELHAPELDRDAVMELVGTFSPPATAPPVCR